MKPVHVELLQTAKYLPIKRVDRSAAEVLFHALLLELLLMEDDEGVGSTPRHHCTVLLVLRS